MLFRKAALYRGSHSRLFAIYQDLAFVLPSEDREVTSEKVLCHNLIPLMEDRIPAVSSPIHTLYRIQTHTIEWYMLLQTRHYIDQVTDLSSVLQHLMFGIKHTGKKQRPDDLFKRDLGYINITLFSTSNTKRKKFKNFSQHLHRAEPFGGIWQSLSLIIKLTSSYGH